MNGSLVGPFVVFDCETTGIFPEEGARICEIGAVKVEHGRIVETFSSLVDPQKPIPAEASAVNGLYDIDLFDAPKFEEVAPLFFSFIGNAPLFGYRVGFDLGFFFAECRRANIRMPFDGSYDVLSMAKDCVQLPHYKLGQVAAHLGVGVGRAHRALDDAKTTFAVYEKLLPMLAERGMREIRTTEGDHAGRYFVHQ
jgi:DNA polymerase-3 subunit alpha (Gram-positive type)